MSNIKPFKGYTPRPDRAAQISSVPYDTLSVAEARPICAENPLSFLHVVKTQADFPESEEGNLEAVQKKGRENLDRFIEDGTLVQSENPSFYIYRQTVGDHTQTGLAVGASTEEYARGEIRKHEFTIQAKEDMMADHMDALNADAGPVILIYPDDPEIDALVEERTKSAPLFEFTDGSGVANALWEVGDEETVRRLAGLFEKIPVLYIADGHHRGAGCSRIAARRKAANPDHTGDEPYNHFLCILFPAGQKRILDYNRVVKDLNGLSPEQILSTIGEKFEVEKLDVENTEEARPPGRARIAMFLDEAWSRLTPKPEIVPDDVRSALDVSILQDNILDPILDIKDPRKNPRIAFVGGSRGIGELERRCREDCRIAFALYPTGIEDLMQIANANEVMPPKSTWFDPKPRSGVVVRRFE